MNDCLPSDEASIGGGHVQLGVRLPWYRSLPLSVVEIAEVVIDGKTVPQERMRLTLDDHTLCPERTGRADGRLLVRPRLGPTRLRLAALDPARDHEVTLTLNLYPPYIPGLTWVTRGSATIKAH